MITKKAFDPNLDVYAGIDKALIKYIPKKYAQFIVEASYGGYDDVHDAITCPGTKVTASDSHTCIAQNIPWFIEDVQSIVLDPEDDQLDEDSDIARNMKKYIAEHLK